MEELKKASHFKKFYVNSYESDKNLELKMNCLFQWFSEIAWEHAKQLNLGFEDLEETEYYWVLLGMNVKINKLPQWQDEVLLQTWPSAVSGLYFMREFILFDSEGEMLAGASSAWLIYNRATSRPVIPKGAEYEYTVNSHRATDQDFSKLRQRKDLLPGLNVTARYTDIDMHRHVNNAVYIKWIENYLGDLHPGRIDTVKIQYMKEIKLNDEIDLLFGNEDDIYYCEAVIRGEYKTSFRAEVKVEKS